MFLLMLVFLTTTTVYKEMMKKRIRLFLLNPRETAWEVLRLVGVKLLFSLPSPPRHQKMSLF